MRQTYFPSTDAGLLAWAQNLSQRLSADYAAFGIDEERAADFAARVDAYAETYRNANVPGVRIVANTRLKSEARESMKAAARLIVSVVRGQPQVSDAQKIKLGITVPAPRRRAIPRPAHAPVLRIDSMVGRTAQVALRNAELETGRSKPRGVQGALIFVATGDEPPAPGSDGWKFHSGTSRTTWRVTFPARLTPGTKVWFSAAWVNTRNQLGPASRAVGTHIQFGTQIDFGGGLALAA
jgi:hypothetical protein